MYQKLLHILLLILLILAPLGCGHRPDSRLVLAESLMDARPDSSLRILDSISPATLHGDGDHALYALLLTQAQDKNWLNPTNDSLISSAVDYYRHTGDERRHAVASHYQGRVRQANKDYSGAILSYYTAKEAALETGQYLIAGLACRGISDIYAGTYVAGEELAYARKEYEYTLKSDRQPYINYALNDLARALVNNEEADQAVRLTAEGLDSAKKYGDGYLEMELMRIRTRAFLQKDDYPEALKTLSIIYNAGEASTSDSLLMSLALSECGKNPEARHLLDSIKGTDYGLENYVRYNVYKNEGKLTEAYRERNLIDTVKNEKWEKTKHLDLGSNVADYYEVTNRYYKSELLNSKLWKIISSLIIICVLLGGGWFIWYRTRRYRSKMREQEWMYTQLTFDLREISAEKDMVEARMDEVEKRALEAEVRAQQAEIRQSEVEEDLMKVSDNIRGLLYSKYKELSPLCKIMMEPTAGESKRRNIYAGINHIIHGLTIGSDGASLMESEVNAMCGNLILDLKKDLPDLDAKDIHLYLLTVLGFSPSAIFMLIMESNIDNVYRRKRRIKRRINSLDEGKKERYIRYLSQK